MTEEIYEHLGVPRLVNAAGGFTAYGGSRMLESTLRRMNEAARSYTDIRTLQAAVHRRLAELTHNEAAFVAGGADAGLYLCAAAAVELRAGRPIRYLSGEEIGGYEVIVFTAHHNPYDFVLQQLGVRTKTLGYANFIEPITCEALQHNITDRTVAIFFFQAEHGWTTQGGLPFEDTLAVARAGGLPVIIDCAAQLPPKENLWKFTQAGATAALFSGGKDLRGPQSSGLVVGEREFLQIVTRIGFPNYGHGRMMKTGREEIVGLYWAVKEYLEADEEARLAWAEDAVAEICRSLAGSRIFAAERDPYSEAGQPIARARLRLLGGITEQQVLDHLRGQDPPVVCGSDEPGQVMVTPMCMEPEEVPIVIEALRRCECDLVPGGDAPGGDAPGRQAPSPE